MKEKRTKRKFRGIVILIAIVVAIALGYFVWSNYFQAGSTNNSAWVPITITAENLPENLEKFSVVKDLPEDSSISLTIGDNEYSIEGSNVESGEAGNAEISITLPEEYFEVVGEKGWCTGVKIAKEKGDIGLEIAEGEEAELLWKYKGLAKYKKCLG